MKGLKSIIGVLFGNGSSDGWSEYVHSTYCRDDSKEASPYHPCECGYEPDTHGYGSEPWEDLNGNGIPDDLEPDYDGDGYPD